MSNPANAIRDRLLPETVKQPVKGLLLGHPYHGKSDAELLYIVKDAGEAARAMRDHSPQAEAKYLDQVNDACSILHARGMVDHARRAA